MNRHAYNYDRLRLSPKKYGELHQNPYAHQQAAILAKTLTGSFGGGIR